MLLAYLLHMLKIQSSQYPYELFYYYNFFQWYLETSKLSKATHIVRRKARIWIDHECPLGDRASAKKMLLPKWCSKLHLREQVAKSHWISRVRETWIKGDYLLFGLQKLNWDSTIYFWKGFGNIIKTERHIEIFISTSSLWRGGRLLVKNLNLCLNY